MKFYSTFTLIYYIFKIFCRGKGPIYVLFEWIEVWSFLLPTDKKRNLIMVIHGKKEKENKKEKKLNHGFFTKVKH